jgi:hypothetical protein
MNGEPLLKDKDKPKVKKITQKMCDNLLSPIVKSEHPICFFHGIAEKCTRDTQVAHHHVHKSKSLALRYDFENLINLCNHCHLMLHCNESFWASKIVSVKGLEWFAYLEKKKQETTKPNYPEIYEYLSARKFST